PKTSHTTIDFQVIWNTNFRQVLQAMDHRRQIELRKPNTLFGKKISHHQDPRANSFFAQPRAFFDIRNGEPFRTLRFERPRNFASTMSVSVGLDHRHNLDALANQIPDGSIVRADAAQRYLNPTSHPFASLVSSFS